MLLFQIGVVSSLLSVFTEHVRFAYMLKLQNTANLTAPDLSEVCEMNVVG